MKGFKVIFEFLNKYGGSKVIADKNNASYIEKEYNILRDMQKKVYDEEWRSNIEYIVGRLKVHKIANTQQWQNSGNIFKYFWTQLKSDNRLESASSISVFARMTGVQVKLTWHFSFGKKSRNSLQKHNMWVYGLEEWIRKNEVDFNKYIIWYEGDGNDGREISLEDYLNNQGEKDFIAKGISNDKNFLVEIGKLFERDYVETNEETILSEVVDMIDELEDLYKATDSETEVSKIIGHETQELVVDGNNYNIKLVIETIRRYILSKSFIYSYSGLANFYLSLKSKPFVILAGVSGTGKSKFVRLFAEAVGATSDNGQFKMISVKPDWNDNTELIGYKDISEKFIPGQLTSIILEAVKPENKDKPYFVCLDEMNLARVEYYLSDYLSLIESREFRGEKIITDKLFSRGYHKDDSPYKDLYLPDNLYLVGTVNMDDTTYAFSRKVLDRANTIEFSEVNLEDLNFAFTDEVRQIVQNNEFLKTRFLNISDALAEDEEYVRSVNNKVIEINNIMKKGNRHFGYRVRDEIVFYMLENKNSGVIGEENTAFDYIIMQKVLPTITGSDTRVKDILIGLYNICNPEKPVVANSSNYLSEAERFLESAKYKKSAAKIIDMLRGYEDGFTSYWI